jgi:hypothetical protein
MRVSSPLTAISAGAEVAAISIATEVFLVDTTNGRTTVMNAPFAAQLAAVAADGTVVVAAGEAVAAISSPAAIASAQVPGQTMVVEVMPTGAVVVAVRTTTGTSLVLLDSGLRAMGEPVALDDVALSGATSVDTRTVLVWGTTGKRPWEGDGRSWAAAYSVGDGALRRVWSGRGLPAESEFAAGASGRLAFVDDETVILSTVEDLVDGVADGGRRVGVVGEIDHLAMSPDGTKAAFAVVDPSSAGSIDIDSATSSGRRPIPEGIHVRSLAVADDGRIVVLGTRGNAAVVVLVAGADGVFVETTTVELPRSMHRDD